MSTIVTRAGKGSPLTHTEVDTNFTNLNTDKLQSGDTVASLTITSADINGGTIDGTAIGSSSASTGRFTSLSDSGNLIFTGTGNRITGDFSNATVANRVAFQTSTSNGATSVHAIPNGIGTTAQFEANNNSDPTNSSNLQTAVLSTEATIRSSIRGTGTYLPLTMYTGGSERVRVDTSGNVGIGTSSPTTKLDVNGVAQVGYTTSGQYVDVYNGDTTNYQRLRLSMSGSNAFITTRRSSGTVPQMLFGIDNAEVMRIDSSGNVGIGTSSPTQKLDISGKVNVDTSNAFGKINLARYSGTLSCYLKGTDSSGSANGFSFGYSGGNAQAITFDGTNILFYNNSDTTERMRIDSSGNLLVANTSLPASAGSARIYSGNAIAASSGFYCKAGVAATTFGNLFNINWTGSPQLWIDSTNVGTFAFTSDYRIKRNIETQTVPALERVMALRPVTYQMADYKDGLFKASEDIKEGFIAHEVQEVIPSGAEGVKDDPEQIQSLRVDAILAVAVKAIQELKAEVDSLKARIETLESK